MEQSPGPHMLIAAALRAVQKKPRGRLSPASLGFWDASLPIVATKGARMSMPHLLPASLLLRSLLLTSLLLGAFLGHLHDLLKRLSVSETLAQLCTGGTSATK
jgi:hypothetical protein